VRRPAEQRPPGLEAATSVVASRGGGRRPVGSDHAGVTPRGRHEPSGGQHRLPGVRYILGTAVELAGPLPAVGGRPGACQPHATRGRARPAGGHADLAATPTNGASHHDGSRRREVRRVCVARVPRPSRPSPAVRQAPPTHVASTQRPARHTAPHAGADRTTRLGGYQRGDGGQTPPDHARVAPLWPREPRDPEVPGPGSLCATPWGAMAAGTHEAGHASRTPAGPVPHQWTRILLRARTMRHATVNAPGRRWSERRRREHRPYGLTWRGLETWPRWNGEPTLPSKEQDWKPSTDSRRASPRPYQATAYSARSSLAPASSRA
jgi:hypothetical protein